MLKRRSLWCIAFGLALASAQLAHAACTPTTARICVEADDEASIYVDGILMGNFSYVNWDSSGTVPCMTITNAAILSALADGGRISTRTHNIGSGEMWLAYSIDVTCSGGQHAYVTSATTGGATGYRQNDCNNPPANPPGSGSANWYDPAFTPSGWSAPVVVTGQTWGKPVYHPGTGALLPMLSYNNTGAAGSSCEYYYMHQPFTLTAVTPPGPPALTITKSAAPSTNISTGTRVTYTLNVCNTGGYTANPVTITDNFNAGFRYDGPNGGNTPTGPNFTASGSTVTITWPNGIPGNACQAVSFWVVDDYHDLGTENCAVRGNTASVAYNNNSSNVTANSNNVNVSMLCATNTPTQTRTWTWSPTRTNTHTPTWTFTPTRSHTPTWTNTWTHTFTQTRTHTPTHTFTQTRSNTPTNTNTSTHTFTLTRTPTWTYTNTWTYTPTRTYTPTWTFTNTFTPLPANTATFTPTRTRTPTPTSTATITRSPSPSSTPTGTLTRTPTSTPSRTASQTPTRTVTLTSSPTNTRTASPTVTITFLDTFTHSPTVTPTRTASRTATPTSTVTATRSSTPTPSPTPSRTASVTVTITFLDTYTHSPSVTPTRTPTRTSTPSPTSTATPTTSNTPSPTPSRTASVTVTITFLDTYTHSPTVTPSPTATPTATPSVTRTATPSRTASVTVTITFLDTFTHSPTVTDTSSATPTATPSVTPSDTRTASPTATPSSTPSITVLDTLTSTPTASPSRTASVTLTATPTATPTRTASVSLTATQTPTPTRTVSVSLTATRTNSPSPSATRTATETRSATASASPTRSQTPTASVTPTVPPIPMPFQLNIGLYTSAGERVRLLYQGASSSDASTVAVSGGLSQPLSLSFQGVLADGRDVLVWDQRNDSGQRVDGGIYVLKIEATDNFGAVTAYNRSLQVLAAPAPASLVLYNAAGEAVRRYDTVALGLDPVDLGRADAGRIELKDRDGGIGWFQLDGLNDQGRPLAGGSYQLVLHWADAAGEHTVTRSVVLVPVPMDDLLAKAALEQNPIPAGQPLILRYPPCSCQVTARLHDLAGQLVTQDTDMGSGRLVFPLDRTAGGVYLLSLEAQAWGQRPSRRTLKAAIVR